MANKTQKAIINLKDRTIIDVFKKNLLSYGGFKLVGFGIFSLKRMKPKEGFNPFTKESETFESNVKLSFSPTKKLKDEIQVWK